MSVLTDYFLGLFKQFKRGDVIVLMCLIAAITVLEMLGVFERRYLTLTDWFRSWMPIWARAIVLAWLCWHFDTTELMKRHFALGLTAQIAISVLLIVSALLEMKLKG